MHECIYAYVVQAYSMLAKQQLRNPAAGHHHQQGQGQEGGEAERSSPAALARTSWQKCLHDTHSSLYYNSSADSLYVVLLKCEALQALDQHEEAVDEVRREGDREGRSRDRQLMSGRDSASVVVAVVAVVQQELYISSH